MSIVSANIFEIEFVKKRFPFIKNMIDVFEENGEVIEYNLIIEKNKRPQFQIKAAGQTFTCEPFHV